MAYKKNHFGRDSPLGSFMLMVDKYIRNPQVDKYFLNYGNNTRVPRAVQAFYNYINTKLQLGIIQGFAGVNHGIGEIYNRWLIEGNGETMNLLYFFWADQ
jgi:hypothetical protein